MSGNPAIVLAYCKIMSTLVVSRRVVRWPILLMVLIAVWAAVAALLFWWINGENKAASRVLQPDEIAPAWSLTAQDGRVFRSQDYTGRAIVLAFLPAGDTDSERELQSLKKEQKRFDEMGVKTFAIADFSVETARQLHDNNKLDFPILLDKDAAVSKQFGAAGANNTNRRISYVIGQGSKILLPVTNVYPATHGEQLYELTACCLEDKPQPASPLIGKPIVNFTLPNVRTGIKETLFGDGRQSATVIFVMSARCPCSARYDGRYVELAKKYAVQGVRVVGLNANDGEAASEIAKHAQEKEYTFPVLQDKNNIVADIIQAQTTPEVFVLDKGGVLRYHGRIDDSRDMAMVKRHDLQTALDFLIAGKNPPRSEESAFGCAIVRVAKTFAK